MIEIDGKLINPHHIVSAEVETRHYMNGSASYLVVRMDDGSHLKREHGFGFDAFAALAKIKGLPSTPHNTSPVCSGVEVTNGHPA